MAVPKPLKFDNAPPAQSTAPAKAPGPLSFPPSPPKPAPVPAAPAVKSLSFPPDPPKPAPPVFFDNGGQWVDGRLVVKTDPKLSVPPAPPAKVPKPLSFDHIKASPPPPAPATPKPVLQQVQAPQLHGDALKALNASHPDIVRHEELRVVRQLQQLLPLQVVVVMDWGTKTMERMRQDSVHAAAMIKTFTQARGNELIEAAVNAATGVTKAGLWQRLTKNVADPISMEPQLAALQSQLGPWMKECDDRIVSAKKQAYDLLIKMATLCAVADSVGTITDNTLELAVNNRRTVLQQGVLQSELIIKQLEDVRMQIIDQRMRIDQMLNVTLPAYKAALAHRK